MKSFTELLSALFRDRFLTWAIALAGLFLCVHLLGFREYVNILSGTGAFTMGRLYGGLLYMLLYICVVGMVPILLIAVVLRYGIRWALSRFWRNNARHKAGGAV